MSAAGPAGADGGFAELDGEEVSAADAASLALSGYGSFTTLLCEDGAARGVDLHLRRLRSDSAQLFGRPAAPAPRIRELLRRAARRAPRSVVRATAFAPGTRAAAPEADGPISVLVTTRAAPAVDADRGAPGLRLSSVRYQRDLPAIKHTGLVGALHRRRAARLAGFDDAVFLGAAGQVLEGPTWSIGFCSPDGEVVWPRGPRLEGVTATLLRTAVPGSRCAPVPWDRLRRAEGWTAFVTSAVTGVRPVASIDGVALDARPDRVEDLQRAYRALPLQQV